MAMTETRTRVIWVTAFYPDVEHAVTDNEMAARGREHRGEYRAVCGAVFLPAPSDRPPGHRCPACQRYVRAQATLPDLRDRLVGRRRRHAQPGWWERLWGGAA